MTSNIQSYYPEVVYDGSQKWLFNPILKKRYKNLPEERVRLQWVDYLLQNGMWTKGRIGFEAPVRGANLEGVLRADLVLYSEEMKPEILIECKAESVSLNQSTAEQAARYNRKLAAKQIILTNGLSHQAFVFEDGYPQPRQSDWPFQQSPITPRPAAYWQKRGFCSPSLRPEIESWLENQFQNFSPGNTGSGRTRYLNFKNSLIPVPMDHYYKIVPLTDTEKMAYSFIGFRETDTYALFVLNNKGKNRALGVINLSELFSDHPPVIKIISSGKEVFKEIPASDFRAIKELDPLWIAKFIRKFFD